MNNLFLQLNLESQSDYHFRMKGLLLLLLLSFFFVGMKGLLFLQNDPIF